MKTRARILLLSLFSITVSTVSADTCSPCNTTPGRCSEDVNKTFLMPRSYSYDLALDYAAGWWELTHKARVGKFGGNLSVTGFYEASQKDDQLGKYFSPQRATCPTPTNICASTCSPCPGNNNFTWGFRLGTDQTMTHDLNLRTFIQMPFPDLTTATAAATAVTMNLEMNRRSYGFNFNYYHNLDNVLRGFFFTVKVPVVHVEHNVDICLASSDYKVGGGDQDLIKAATFTQALQSYFNGEDVELPLTVEDAATGQMSFNTLNSVDIFDTTFPVLQDRLTCLLIPSGAKNACGNICPRGNLSRSGVADIDWTFGYHIINQEAYKFALTLGATIPTGNAVTSDVIWEPMIGNGRHWALGGGYEAAWMPWGNREHNIRLISVLNARYLFENCQQRVLGLCGVPWGQYSLLGKVGQATLVPAANVLCQKVDVSPGAMVDFIVQADWNYCGFGFDVGYNLYYHQEEKVALHDCTTILEEDTYAFPSKNFHGTTAAFTAADRLADSLGNRSWLNDSALDFSRAQTPSQLTHKIYGSLSYTCCKNHIPVLMGITGHYEFGNKNAELETWGVALKVGASF